MLNPGGPDLQVRGTPSPHSHLLTRPPRCVRCTGALHRAAGTLRAQSISRHIVLASCNNKFLEKHMLLDEPARLIRISAPSLIIAVASVVGGCASSPGGHASANHTPPGFAAPAPGTTTAGGTASEVSTAAVASTTASSPATGASTTATPASKEAASPTAASTTTASASKDPKADAKITCRVEVPTGSRVGRRVCETAAQREAREAAVRDQRDQLSRPSPNCGKVGAGGCNTGG